MENIGENPARTLRAAWRMRAQAHPWTAFGLATAAIAMLWLLVASGWQVYKGEADAAVRLAFLGGMAAFAATASGAVPGIALRGLSQRLEDSMLGFAAGMMLAASSFSLILPGLEATETISGSAGWGAVTVVAGMALGVLLMLGLDTALG
jgi:ZIP family zinc transporter